MKEEDGEEGSSEKIKAVAAMATHGGIMLSTMDPGTQGHGDAALSDEYIRGGVKYSPPGSNGVISRDSHHEKVIDAQQMAYDALLERLVSTENQLAQARRTINEQAARERQWSKSGVNPAQTAAVEKINQLMALGHEACDALKYGTAE